MENSRLPIDSTSELLLDIEHFLETIHLFIGYATEFLEHELPEDIRDQTESFLQFAADKFSKFKWIVRHTALFNIYAHEEELDEEMFDAEEKMRNYTQQIDASLCYILDEPPLRKQFESLPSGTLLISHTHFC